MPAKRQSAREYPTGEPWPLGAHICCDGTNFAVFSRHATELELFIFDRPQSAKLSLRVKLDAQRHRTGDIWHVRLPERLHGQCYAYRAVGPSGAKDRFDGQRLLIDPYATDIVARERSDVAPDNDGKQLRMPPYLGVVAEAPFDWQDSHRPQHAWRDTIIYETHVRGLTMHPSSAAQHRGQYLGVVEKIPYLKSLGITAIELQPVQAFVAQVGDGESGRRDYWGYNPVALFAPHAAYASDDSHNSPLVEFKTMVRELHRAGIEVILDVVFNHTGEGGHGGPTISFRGLDNDIYYLTSPDGAYLDFTGCGNTLNCNHPVVRSLIIDCLRHWVVHFHIDGFRFDLAAVLGRGEDGSILSNAPVLEQIAEDPILRDVKLIAEAWDAGGAFEVGSFADTRWGEWNCHFRDDVRRFWRGDPGMTGALATRLCGSADLYQHDRQTPLKSVNFVTCHDGFTLRDLCSYSVKHNEANGEDNRDGMNENLSANYGVEGATTDTATIELRERQAKNFLLTLLLSRGVPMLLGGDEFGRTQRGNNNAYCQDNELSWYDWQLCTQNAGLVRFVSRLIRLRLSHPVLREDRFYTAEEIQWFGPTGATPDWHGPTNRLGCIVLDADVELCVLFNADSEATRFVIPAQPGRHYRICIDTSRASPNDAPDPDHAAIIDTNIVELSGRAAMVLRSL